MVCSLDRHLCTLMFKLLPSKYINGIAMITAVAKYHACNTCRNPLLPLQNNVWIFVCFVGLILSVYFVVLPGLKSQLSYLWQCCNPKKEVHVRSCPNRTAKREHTLTELVMYWKNIIVSGRQRVSKRTEMMNCCRTYPQ